MKEEIVKIIADILEVDDLPEWDSMHHLQIIAELEKVYNIKFNASDLAELEDVSDLISLVEEMKEA